MRLGIVGLGLIGGSLAAAAKARWGGEVVAVDRASVVGDPRAAELADVRVDAEGEWEWELERVDLIVLAVPVRAIEGLLERALRCGPPVTDCGSTKRSVARRAHELGGSKRFVPSHPMAGAPEGGLANARADLFVDRRWIVCPEQSDAAAIEVVREVATRAGAIAVEMTAVEHDRVVAMTSHVPQILSSVLAMLGERRSALSGVGPAFLSATQRAGGNARMWRDIFATNHDEVAAALWDVAQELEGVAAALGRDDPDLEPVMRVLEQARSKRVH